MSTEMMSLNETVVTKLIALYEGWFLNGQLIYRPGEPLSATLRLFSSNSQSVDWELSLDLLRLGVDSEKLLGPGNWNIRRYGADVVLVLPAKGSKAQILINRHYVNKFLAAVKPAALDVDAEIEKLLGTEGE